MAQIDALLARAKATDDAEVGEPELDLPAEIARRDARVAAIRQARERLEQRQREAHLQRGRSDDDRRPRGPDGQLEPPSWRAAGGCGQTRCSPLAEEARGSRAKSRRLEGCAASAARTPIAVTTIQGLNRDFISGEVPFAGSPAFRGPTFACSLSASLKHSAPRDGQMP